MIFYAEKQNPLNFKILIHEKQYNWAIFHQIKKRICFNIYKTAYSHNIA